MPKASLPRVSYVLGVSLLVLNSGAALACQPGKGGSAKESTSQGNYQSQGQKPTNHQSSTTSQASWHSEEQENGEVAAAGASSSHSWSPGNSGEHKIGICHATGSATNPFVYIVVDEHAEQAHASHQDDRDIIGVTSAADCPAGVTPPGQGGGGGGVTPPPTTTQPSTPGKGGTVGDVTSVQAVSAQVAATTPATTVGQGGVLPQTGSGLVAVILSLAGAMTAAALSRFRRKEA